jgi:universal stress protein family protein
VHRILYMAFDDTCEVRAVQFIIGQYSLYKLFYRLLSAVTSNKSAPDSIPGSEITQNEISNVPDVQYNGILVPHDGSEKSDIALRHAIYLSKLSGAEIIILNVIEHAIIQSPLLAHEWQHIVGILLFLYILMALRFEQNQRYAYNS